MIKNTVIALIAAATLAGAVAPAFADSNGAFGSGSSDDREFVASSILANLRHQGVNASSVEEWSDLVRAYVTLEDGTQTMQLFTPGTLQPVSL